jgi:hypothetical protein
MSSQPANRRVEALSAQLATSAAITGGSGTQASSRPSTSALHGYYDDDSIRTVEAERKHATFNSRELTHFLSGGRHLTACKERAMAELEASAALANENDYDMDRADTRRVTMERIRAIYRMFMADGGDLDMRNARIEVTVGAGDGGNSARSREAR